MKRRNTLPELLAPAGDFECLCAAVAGGADAVYVGGKRFGARAFAKNFDIDELARALSYCHLHGVKLYVTLNTLIEDKEMPEVLSYAAELYRIGVDALIIADLGAISAIRRYLPELELHASTQMSVHSTLGANAAVKLGVSRVVVARELSLEDIRSVVDNCGCEIEVFLHGALCVCHSGQCLFSSMVGGRSGNRGECAQPCRLPYNGTYPLSLRDLSLADHIPALIDSGVASLKIEGRMKSPAYVYTVTGIYRRLLDERRSATENEKQELRRAFSRGGFTDGYFRGDTRFGMTGIRTEEDKQDSRAMQTNGFAPIRVSVRAEAALRLGRPSVMSLTDGTRTVTVEGAVPVAAESSPLETEAVKARLAKMGNTFLSLSAEDINLTLDEGINLPPSAINALRRQAAEAFESFSRPAVAVEYIPEACEIREKPLITAHFFNEEGFLDVSRDDKLLSKIDISFIPLFSSRESLALANGVALPPVIFDSEQSAAVSALKKAREQGVKYALVGNIGQIEPVKSLGFIPIGDFRLNVTNSESAAVYRKMGTLHTILSPELTLPKARDIGGSMIVYGRLPLMITERCFIRDNFGCDKCGKCALTDRKGEKFPLIRAADHRNIILNSVHSYMGDRKDELYSHRLRSHHLMFTNESGEEIRRALTAYLSGRSLPHKVRRVGRR